MSKHFHMLPGRTRRLLEQFAKATALSACCLLLRACSSQVALGGTSDGTEGGAADASAAGGGSEATAEAGAGGAGAAGSSGSGPDAVSDSGNGDAADSGEAPCPKYESGVSRGAVSASGLFEASGLAVSRKNARVVWAHNDSGDEARVFALRDDAAGLGVYEIDGASAVDWEDMAIGPGPQSGEDYLYMGDIGDNDLGRSTVSVYRVAEPAIDALAAPQDGTLTGSEKIELRYPDGAHNAETLLVDPISTDLFIVTKDPLGQSQVYRAAGPLVATRTTDLVRVASLRFGEGVLAGSPLATGGDIAASGAAILIRTYTSAFLWRRAPGTTLAEAFSGTPCVVPVRDEPQGEAISFAPDESGYFSLGEATSPPLYFFAKQR